MKLILILPLLALAACASEPKPVEVVLAPPVPKAQKLRDIIPAAQLVCQSEPDGTRVATVRQSAKYIIDLKKSGANCRQKLSVVREIIGNQE